MTDLQTVYDRQDKFVALMLDDYTSGKYPILNQLKPYFDWKANKASSIPNEAAYDMRIVIGDALDEYYDKYPQAYKFADKENSMFGWYNGYGDDKYIVSYLEAINGELENFLF